MRVVMHGGKCCGVKTIHTLFQSPEYLHSRINKKRGDIPFDGGSQCAGKNFLPGPYPTMKGKDLLRRFIIDVEKKRPKGIIEVAVANNQFNTSATVPNDNGQVKNWRPVLEEFGFVQYVPATMNSNSGNFVFLFHRLSGQVPKLEEVKKEKEAE